MTTTQNPTATELAAFSFVNTGKVQPRVKSIAFEMDTCGRCGGAGRMPFAAYGGVCFGCNGKGQIMTRKGAAAHKRVQEVKATECSKLAQDLQVGDKLANVTNNGHQTIESVTIYGPDDRDEAMAKHGAWSEGGMVYIETTKSGLVSKPGISHKLVWTQDGLRKAAQAVAKMTGATVTWA